MASETLLLFFGFFIYTIRFVFSPLNIFTWEVRFRSHKNNISIFRFNNLTIIKDNNGSSFPLRTDVFRCNLLQYFVY